MNTPTPYLTIADRSTPIVKWTHKPYNGLQKIVVGTMPTDNKNYIFTDDEKKEFLDIEPNARKYFNPFVNAKDFINGSNRWILTLHKCSPHELKKMTHVQKRIKAVMEFRKNSKKKSTRELAKTPTVFDHIMIPKVPFLLIPSTSSIRRNYVPMAYMKPPTIPSKATMVIENATVELFGLITSKMHMVWLRTIGGKLKNDFRYSGGMIYNTFPVPPNYTSLKPYAQKILDVRTNYSDSTLADLYDPNTMPAELLKSHQSLDRAVDKLYTKKPFKSDSDRISFLLEKYEELVSKKEVPAE